MSKSLPKDLNDVDAWPAEYEVDEIFSRLSELPLSAFEALLDLDFLSLEDSVGIARAASQLQPDVSQKILWLQTPLLSEDLWPETQSDGWHTDYLELMWEILSIVGELESPQEAAATFDAIAPHSWYNPIAPAAILALWPEQLSQANSVLNEFLTNCRPNEDGFESVREVAFTEVAAMVPIVAIASVYQGVDTDLALRAVRAISQPKSSDEPTSTESLCSDFWDYFLLLLVDERSTSDLWCPNIWWRDGFFMNGIPDGPFQVDMVNLLAIAELFLAENDQWEFENAYGEDDTREKLEGAMTQVRDALGSPGGEELNHHKSHDRQDLEMFSSIAASLAIIDDLSVHTFLKDDDVWAFSIESDGNELFEESDLPQIDDLLHELLTAGFAKNSWDTIEEESRDEGDSQFTWYFEIPLLEKFKTPGYLAKLIASTSVEAESHSGFEERKFSFFSYGLQRIAALLTCDHEFEDAESFDETCKKCNSTVWDPSAFLENYQQLSA